ncbi:MAG: enoyl-CoA hydratase-related protein [Candidatus Dormibacteria bacterium]
MSSDSSPVQVDRRDGYLLLTIDHPPANAISRAVIADLREGIQLTHDNPELRCVVITGSGSRFFAAGADITEFREAGGEAISAGQRLTLEIESLHVPVIAAVNGIALGGGCEIALACDIRIAARSARFGQPEINLGIIPGWGGTQRLPRLIGRSRAMPLLFTGEQISAEQALDWGLVSQVVEPGELEQAAEALARTIAAKAPLAVAATKAAVGVGLDKPIAKGLEDERQEFVHVFKSDDAVEGVTAFLEKRTPTWRGH